MVDHFLEPETQDTALEVLTTLIANETCREYVSNLELALKFPAHDTLD